MSKTPCELVPHSKKNLNIESFTVDSCPNGRKDFTAGHATSTSCGVCCLVRFKPDGSPSKRVDHSSLASLLRMILVDRILKGDLVEGLKAAREGSPNRALTTGMTEKTSVKLLPPAASHRTRMLPIACLRTASSCVAKADTRATCFGEARSVLPKMPSTSRLGTADQGNLSLATSITQSRDGLEPALRQVSCYTRPYGQVECRRRSATASRICSALRDIPLSSIQAMRSVLPTPTWDNYRGWGQQQRLTE